MRTVSGLSLALLVVACSTVGVLGALVGGPGI